MTWVEASMALRWAGSRTVWHHLASVSNGLNTSFPLLHHSGTALPSLMLSVSVSASLSHTENTNTQQTEGPQQTEKAGAERRRIGRKGKWRENREVHL